MSGANLWARVRALVGFGQINTIDDSGTVQTGQLALGSHELKDATPIVQHYGFTSRMPPGGDAVAIFVSGDRSNGVVIATNHQTYRLRALANGDVALYDMRGASVLLSAAGIVVNGAGLEMRITNTPLVRIESVLHVTGDVIDNCDTQTETLAQQRAIFDEHTHPVPNVQGGSSTVTSDPPTQQEV